MHKYLNIVLKSAEEKKKQIVTRENIKPLIMWCELIPQITAFFSRH